MFRTVNDKDVRGFLHEPEHGFGDGLVLTHGAGGNCQAPLLVALANAFSQAGIAVLRCDLPFRQKRPHGPPPRGSAEADQQGLRAAAQALRGEVAGRLFLGGHSYGGRQASMLAAADPGIADGLLLLSYPLHPPMRPTEMRIAHFPALRTSAIFVHGSRDGFGTHEEFREAMTLIPGRTELLEVAAAGHELLTKRNAEQLPRDIRTAFAEFYQIEIREK